MRQRVFSYPGLFALAAASLVAVPPAITGAGPTPVSGDPAAEAASSDTLETVAERARRSVVLIEVDGASGSRQGSGFIVDPDGRIFTNQHVIEGAESVRVKLASGDVFERVEILGVDERRDIAVIEIPGFDLPALPLGNSDSVHVGQPVIAIGSPLGLENTVSSGIVSGRRREPGGYSLLQITAPTSQGSSGGPVITDGGQVIGIAVSQIRDGQNLNFAVPINYARGLSSHLQGEPTAVLGPKNPGSGEHTANAAASSPGVNRGLTYDLTDFRGYTLEIGGPVGEGRHRRSRITYRRIQSVQGPPRIERYAISETTDSTGPFNTPQTVRRERSRAIVSATDLRPIAVRGESAWWDGSAWHDREYDLEFEGYRVTGTITDTGGTVRELSRELPPGVLLRSTRHLAFATLAEDSLVGRSVELVTFDASSGETEVHRYDVRGSTTVRVGDRDVPALRVNLASGLNNTTAYFRRDAPRVLLRRDSPGGDGAERLLELRLHGTGADPSETGDTEDG